MIHLVIGTKAQLIKMAPVMVRLGERSIPYRFISTGQHRSTMDEILEQFGLREPDVALHEGREIDTIPRMAAWLAGLAARAATDRARIFGEDPEGIVLVHGDALTALLGALMGRLAGLRVGHVESGLRSFDPFHPFPEEITRLAVMRLSDVLYCPGPRAVANCAGLGGDAVDTGGNTISDSLALALEAGRGKGRLPTHPFGLVSLHRFENIYRPAVLQSLVDRLVEVAGLHRLLFILHPPTRKRLAEGGHLERLEAEERIELRPRCPYFDFVTLLQAAAFVITDGGSIQEECSCLGVPCLLLRKATERQDGIGGNVVLSGYDPRLISDFVSKHERYRTQPAAAGGCVSDVIIDSALQWS